MSSLFHGVALRMIARQLPLRRGANGVRRKIRTAVSGSGSFSVLSAISIPGLRNKRIRSCVRAPLKSRPCVRGAVIASAMTEGVVFSEAHSGCTHTVIAVSRPVTYGKTGTAGDRWSPLRVAIGSDQDRGNSHHGKLCYISAKILRRTPLAPLRKGSWRAIIRSATP